MKCIAIDDEPVALSILREYCNRYQNIELQTFTSPDMGMRAIYDTNPDIVFLDIELNGTSGIDLARRLVHGTCLIFTTAYAQYALEGYEVDAVDFLHKPYFYERFCRAMRKAEEFLKSRELLTAKSERQIVLKSEYKNVPIAIDKIVYIESIDNYVKIHLSDNSTVISKTPLRNVEEMLPADNFTRIHRSFIVAVKSVERFTRSEILLAKTSISLPIGKTYADDVIRTLSK